MKRSIMISDLIGSSVQVSISVLHSPRSVWPQSIAHSALEHHFGGVGLSISHKITLTGRALTSGTSHVSSAVGQETSYRSGSGQTCTEPRSQIHKLEI